VGALPLVVVVVGDVVVGAPPVVVEPVEVVGCDVDGGVGSRPVDAVGRALSVDDGATLDDDAVRVPDVALCVGFVPTDSAATATALVGGSSPSRLDAEEELP
jgi:hypothetical protein